jgi:hypothetical protein
MDNGDQSGQSREITRSTPREIAFSEDADDARKAAIINGIFAVVVSMVGSAVLFGLGIVTPTLTSTLVVSGVSGLVGFVGTFRIQDAILEAARKKRGPK